LNVEIFCRWSWPNASWSSGTPSPSPRGYRTTHGRPDRIAVAGTEEPGIHRVRDDGVYPDDVAPGDPLGNANPRFAYGVVHGQPHPFSVTSTLA
jgi:hypothetical protein